MGSWEFEREEFIKDRDSGKLCKQADIRRVKSALGELGLGVNDVGPELVVDVVNDLQPSLAEQRYGYNPADKPKDVTEMIVDRLVERALGME